MEKKIIYRLILTGLLICPLGVDAKSEQNDTVPSSGAIRMTLGQDGEPIGDGIWRKTIIVTTLDGTTMEYLIDRQTKVRMERPYLVIETEGVVLSYELESMGQVRYGRRFVPSGIHSPEIQGNEPFEMKNETLYFTSLPSNTLVEVYTTDGKTVLSQRFTGYAEVSLNSFPYGVYLIKVSGETYKIHKR